MIKIRFRRDTSSNWFQANPVLAEGEPGFESDTGILKIGDGETRWLNLDHFATYNPATWVSDETIRAAVQAHVNDTTPHPVYDDGPSLLLLYQNAKV